MIDEGTDIILANLSEKLSKAGNLLITVKKMQIKKNTLYIFIFGLE